MLYYTPRVRMPSSKSAAQRPTKRPTKRTTKRPSAESAKGTVRSVKPPKDPRKGLGRCHRGPEVPFQCHFRVFRRQNVIRSCVGLRNKMCWSFPDTSVCFWCTQKYSAPKVSTMKQACVKCVPNGERCLAESPSWRSYLPRRSHRRTSMHW